MPPPLTRDNIAAVVHAECGGFRAGGSFSREASIQRGLYDPRRQPGYEDGQWQQKLAVAIVVTNLSRQRLPWGDGDLTMRPLRPRGTDAETRASWDECLMAADEALQRMSYPLTDPRVMEGAQFYSHSAGPARNPGRRLILPR